jgi:hypothetical protein
MGKIRLSNGRITSSFRISSCNVSYQRHFPESQQWASSRDGNFNEPNEQTDAVSNKILFRKDCNLLFPFFKIRTFLVTNTAG